MYVNVRQLQAENQASFNWTCTCMGMHYTMKIDAQKKKNSYARCGARTHDPEIKSLMLYRLS